MLSIALCWMFVAQVPVSQPTTSTPGHDTPEVAQLARGLTLIREPRDRWPLVAIQLWVRAGSRHARGRPPGVAAEVARQINAARDRQEAKARRPSIAALGGVATSEALRDGVVFSVVLPADAVELGVERVLRVFARQRFGDGAASTDPPDTRAQLRRWLAAMRHLQHDYRRLPDAKPDTPLLASDLQDFHRRTYQPQRAALVVVGDIQAKALRRLVEVKLSRLPRCAAPLSLAPVLDLPRGRRELYLQTSRGSGAVGVAQALTLRGPKDRARLRVLACLMCEASCDQEGHPFFECDKSHRLEIWPGQEATTLIWTGAQPSGVDGHKALRQLEADLQERLKRAADPDALRVAGRRVAVYQRRYRQRNQAEARALGLAWLLDGQVKKTPISDAAQLSVQDLALPAFVTEQMDPNQRSLVSVTAPVLLAAPPVGP